MTVGENSEIEWTDHTFSPWWGCEKISPACDHCYAEAWAKRTGFPNLWSTPHRRTFSDKHWNEPRRWNKQHEAFSKQHGRRQRIFCASMADVFDNKAPEGERSRLWQLIRETPNLDWLLLTKRIGNAARMLPDDWGPYPNVGLIDLQLWSVNRVGLHWVIIGGESGNRARPSVIGDIRILKEQCEAGNVPVFVKQLGSRPVDRLGNRFEISDRKGKVMEEWPKDLRVRQFPRAAA